MLRRCGADRRRLSADDFNAKNFPLVALPGVLLGPGEHGETDALLEEAGRLSAPV
ncbi:MAG: hypothetical protein ACE5I3_05490 [Phycisphaerae bacterium]